MKLKIIKLTSPKLGSLLMPLVSGVDDSSTDTEIKLNNLYNNDSCAILVGKDNTQAYKYCSNFWSNILGKGMEQGITQLGLSVASVTDELNSLNDLSDVLNKNDGIVTNEPLNDFIAKNHDVVVHNIDYNYRSSSYNKKNRDANEKEIIVCYGVK